MATALITGAFLHYALGFDLLEGMLIGSIVGSTDYASVSNILRSKNLNLKYNTASLLELESGSNDPTAYTMTMVFISYCRNKSIYSCPNFNPGGYRDCYRFYICLSCWKID